MLISLTIGFVVSAQTTFTSNGTGGGNWDSGTTWDQGGATPGASDNVIIATGDVVTMANTGTRNITDLTLLGTGNLNWTASRRLNVSGDLTMSGTSSLTGTAGTHRIEVSGNFDIPSGTATIGGIRIGQAGITTIDGTLSFTSATGSKTFTDITVNTGGVWDNGNVTENFNIDGSIIVNASSTWTGCFNTTGCRYTFRTNGSTISGAGTVNVTDIRVNNGVTLTNNGNLVVTDNIDGAAAPITGVFVNGATGVLTLADNGAYSEITFTLNTVGNSVIYAGTGNENINLGPFYDLEINKATATTRVDVNGADVTVNNNLVLTQGRMRLHTANTLTVTGNVTVTENSEFEPNNSEAVANIGGNLSMTGGIFDHNDGDVNVTGDIIITGGTMTMNESTTPVNPSTIDATDMSIATGAVTLSEGTLTLSNVSGGLTVTSGSLTLNNSSHTLSIAGDYDVQGGINDINSGTISFVNMDVTTGGAINVASPTITSTGTITVDNGTYTSDGSGGTYDYNNITVNSNGNWNVTSAYDPTVSGNIVNNGTFTGCNGTGCNYTLTSTSGSISGSGAMNTMSDFILNDGASYTNTNSGGLNISDRLATTSGTGTFINGVNGVMSYGGSTGNFNVSNFTASANPNTVTYNRTGNNQAIEPTTDGIYHNLIIDKADGINATTSSVITINGTLTMTLGDLIMGSQNLILADGATISGGSATSYIQDNGSGVLRQVYSAAGSTLSFPIGDSDDYSPITALTINSATFGASPYLEFSVTDANHPNRNTNNTGAGGDDDGTTAVAFISRYWTITPNDITSPRFNASYVYVDADVTGTEANMVGTIYRTPPGHAFLDWHVGGTVNATNNTVSITNIDAFGDLYAMDNTTERLPIVLLSFDATVIEDIVKLEWVTVSEENNEFYTVERSIDGNHFTPLLITSGAGNSSELLSYEAIDKNPLPGTSFYRLKQTDFNGQFEYSEIRSVYYDGNSFEQKVLVYPNPVVSNQKVNVRISEDYDLKSLQLKLLDRSGRSVHFKHELIGKKGIRLDISGLKPGVFFLKLSDGQNSFTKKMIIRSS